MEPGEVVSTVELAQAESNKRSVVKSVEKGTTHRDLLKIHDFSGISISAS